MPLIKDKWRFLIQVGSLPVRKCRHAKKITTNMQKL